MLNRLEQLYSKKIDGKGLALFRIFFSLVFLAETCQLFYFRHLVFDPIPYLEPSEFLLWPLFVIWFGVILMVILGLFTRVAAIINYLLTVIFLGAITSFEYHMFYAYLTVNFLFIFLPVARNFSLDRLRLKLKYSNTRFHYHPPTTVPASAYFITVFLGLALVYFDSVFWKSGSYLWTHGLGMWLPASMPQAAFFNISPLLNFKYLMLFLGYLTIAFETLFLFTFWRKKWRLPILIIGIGLHIGILICFPIPFFALGVICVYLLLVPVSWWQKLFAKRHNKPAKLKVYYDADCPLCNRTKIVITHLDYKHKVQFLTVQAQASKTDSLQAYTEDELLENIHAVNTKNRVFKGVDVYLQVCKRIWYLAPLAFFISLPGLYQLAQKLYKWVAVNRITNRCTEESCGYEPPRLPVDESAMKITQNFTLKDLKVRAVFYGLVILCCLQIIVTFNSVSIRKIEQQLNIENSAVINGLNTISNGVNSITKVFWGLTHHAVFMDSHFDRYNHSVGVVYNAPNGKEIWLPMTNEQGTPGNYLLNFIWINWSYRVMDPDINQEHLVKGLRDYTAFWAHHNGIDLKKATFKVKVKKNRVPKTWEYNFLNKQLQHPWLDAGTVHWNNQQFSADIKVIENM